MNFKHHFFDVINILYKMVSIKLPSWQILNKKYKIFLKSKKLPCCRYEISMADTKQQNQLSISIY